VFFFSIGEDAVEGRDGRDLVPRDGGSLEEAGIIRRPFAIARHPLVSRISPRKVAFCSATIADWVSPEKMSTQEGGKGKSK
jgi:hypothetical protein